MSKKRVIEFTEKELQDYLERRENIKTLGAAHQAANKTVIYSLLILNRDDINYRFEQNRIHGSAKLSEKKIAEALIRVEGGEHYTDIAEEYGVGPCTLRYHVRKAGLKPKPKPQKTPDEWVQRKGVKLMLDPKMRGFVPKNRYTKPHILMTRAMQA